MKALLYLYPPAWQKRYRAEVARHLDESGERGPRTALDLLAGAVDAWLNTDAIPGPPTEESQMNHGPTASNPIRTPGDGIRFAATMLTVTLVLVSLGVLLDKVVGQHVAFDALMHSAWLVAALVAAWPYLATRPRAIRIAVAATGVSLIYGVVLVLVVVAARVG